MKQFGFPKRERIVNNKDFELVYKKGTIKKSGILIVRYLPNNLGYPRLGIAISKKMFRKSVMRNRVKRLIREAFRLNKQQLPKELDIIVGIRNDNNADLSKQITFSQIQIDLLKLFNKEQG